MVLETNKSLKFEGPNRRFTIIRVYRITPIFFDENDIKEGYFDIPIEKGLKKNTIATYLALVSNVWPLTFGPK